MTVSAREKAPAHQFRGRGNGAVADNVGLAVAVAGIDFEIADIGGAAFDPLGQTDTADAAKQDGEFIETPDDIEAVKLFGGFGRIVC